MGSSARRGAYLYADDVHPAYELPANWTARSSAAKPQPYRTHHTQDDEELNTSYRQPRLHIVPKTNESKRQAKGSKIWIVWLIAGSLLALLLLQLFNFLIGWGTDISDTFHYGPNRTSLVSGVFGHNNDSEASPTLVIAMNIKGKLLLEEVPAGDVSKVKTYPTNVTLIGSDAAKVPVTLSTMPGRSGPNVLIQVSGQRTALQLVNNGTDFTVSQEPPSGG